MIPRERMSPGRGNSMPVSAYDTNPKHQRGRDMARPRWRFGLVWGTIAAEGGVGKPGGFTNRVCYPRAGGAVVLPGGFRNRDGLGRRGDWTPA